MIGMVEYQRQDAQMTLKEGIAEYYRIYPEFQGSDDFLGQDRDTVFAHDVCHVVFGLGATSEEELIVEVWTFFGCSFPVQKIIEVRKVAFVQELMKLFGMRRMLRRLFLSLPRVLRAIGATRRMHKRWPHYGHEPYADTPLCEIRREFGIRIV
jgi:hypothetical protein